MTEHEAEAFLIWHGWDRPRDRDRFGMFGWCLKCFRGDYWSPPEMCDECERDADEEQAAAEERVVRDDADELSKENWAKWVNALPVMEFVAFCSHDWDPDGPHSANGCRVGDRLDLALSAIDLLRELDKFEDFGEPLEPGEPMHYEDPTEVNEVRQRAQTLVGICPATANAPEKA